MIQALLLAVLLSGPSTTAAQAPLAGTYSLVAADDLKPDGTRVPAYGVNPQGLLVLFADGRYALQIYRSDRVAFASGNKKKGTPAEYEAASLGMSTHFGRYVVDEAAHTITFRIEAASFPNWNGADQTRPYEQKGDELSYRVPATPDGTVPISVWKRLSAQ